MTRLVQLPRCSYFACIVQREVILNIAMSLDGYIAGPGDELDWLDLVKDGTEDYGYEAFNSTVDTYIVGRHTYDTVRKLTGGHFPQAERHKCYVLTRRERPASDTVTYYSGDVAELIRDLKQREGLHIYCDGGSQIVERFRLDDLIDRCIISIIPTLLGDGKPLFTPGFERRDLELLDCRHYPSGLVQVQYRPVSRTETQS